MIASISSLLGVPVIPSTAFPNPNPIPPLPLPPVKLVTPVLVVLTAVVLGLDSAVADVQDVDACERLPTGLGPVLPLPLPPALVLGRESEKGGDCDLRSEVDADAKGLFTGALFSRVAVVGRELEAKADALGYSDSEDASVAAAIPVPGLETFALPNGEAANAKDGEPSESS